uniref:Reverse transcriptase domain-containing protein n=1 Tax=Angiostrongylus cantonensis TaxID=6313 RepID=A0A0K0DLE9_ANGCA
MHSKTLEWDNMGVKIDGRQLHRLGFADDIVLETPDIYQAERMLADFDEACGKIGLRLNLKKTMFMKNGLVSFAPFTLNGTNTSELCLSRSGNQYDERLSSRAEQKETSGKRGNFQEHRGRSEENKGHPTPCPPFRLNGVRNLVAAQAR